LGVNIEKICGVGKGWPLFGVGADLRVCPIRHAICHMPHGYDNRPSGQPHWGRCRNTPAGNQIILLTTFLGTTKSAQRASHTEMEQEINGFQGQEKTPASGGV